MMRLQIGRSALVLGQILLLAGCASGTQQTVEELGNRLQAQLTPQLANGDVALQPLPDGTRVTLSDQSLFATGSTELSDKGRYVLASLIEGLMEPRLLEVNIEGSPTAYPTLQQARVAAVRQFFTDYFLGQLIQPPPADAGGATPLATAITVRVVPRRES